MDDRLLGFLEFLMIFDENRLPEDDKDILQDLYKGWCDQYSNYAPNISPKEVADVVRVGKTLLREPCDVEGENRSLIKAIEYLLAHIIED